MTRAAYSARARSLSQTSARPTTHQSFFCSSKRLFSDLSHASSSSLSASTRRSSTRCVRSSSRSLCVRASSCRVLASSSVQDASCCSVKSSLAERRRCARDSSANALDGGAVVGGSGVVLKLVRRSKRLGADDSSNAQRVALRLQLRSTHRKTSTSSFRAVFLALSEATSSRDNSSSSLTPCTEILAWCATWRY